VFTLQRLETGFQFGNSCFGGLTRSSFLPNALFSLLASPFGLLVRQKVAACSRIVEA
jgi:hypothetical protein